MAIEQSTKPVLCACGCGQPAPLHSRTGQQCRYVQSHSHRINRKGYVRVRHDGESAQVHVLVATAALGKPLPKGAEVHHADGNKRNNVNANLVICPDAAYHNLLHQRARVVRAGGDPNTQRLCTACKTLKLLAQFNRRQAECKPCQSTRFKTWAAAKREKKARDA